MKTINISDKKFKTLDILELPKDIVSSESEIYKFSYQNQKKIMKKLYNFSGVNFANKLYTVEMLNTYQELLPEEMVIPDYLISINHIVSGFTVPLIEGIPLTTILNNRKENPEYVKKLLIQIGELLNKLKAVRKNTDNPLLKDLFINDLHESNFVVDKKGIVHAIDLDSCKIAGNKIAPSRYLVSYDFIKYNKCKYKIQNDMIIPTENTEIYCYIMIIFYYLFGRRVNMFTIEEYYRYLYYLESLGIDQELLSCFYLLTDSYHNINPVDYIETLTTEQIARSRENIYKLNKEYK